MLVAASPALPTVTVTSAAASKVVEPASVAVTRAVFAPPSSATEDCGPAVSLSASTVSANDMGAVSSSLIVSVASVGLATPWPPVAAPLTLTVASAASTWLSVAVTVTVPLLVVAPAAMVRSALSPSAAGAPSGSDTVTVTASSDLPDSVAVTVLALLLPLSLMVAGSRCSDTVGVVSSSSMVSVTSSGPATPPPLASPDTATSRFGWSRSSFAAVMATVPALVVTPAAMVSTLLPLSAALAPSGRETVTVTGSLDLPDSVAVTVLALPGAASLIFAGASFSVTVGALSSSATVSVTPVGSATPPPLAVPDTVTVRDPLATSSFFAVIVTVPVLVVLPAAMVSTLSSLSVAGAPAGSETVTVTCSLDLPDSSAVTALAVVPPLSLIVAEASFSVTVGVVSSSLIVIVSPLTVTPFPAAPPTVMVSAPSARSSCFGVSVNDLEALVCPASMAMSKSATVS